MRVAPKLLLVLVLLFMGVGLVHADTVPLVDPVIDLSDPPGCSPFHPLLCPHPIFTLTSTIPISVNPSGGGYEQFTNFTGVTITSILFEAPLGGQVVPGNVTCLTNAFVNCNISSSGGTLFISFFGVSCTDFDGDNDADDHNGPCGWLNNQILTVNLNDNSNNTNPGGTGHWVDANGNPVTLTFQTNTPEPSSMALLAGGSALMWRRWRKRKS